MRFRFFAFLALSITVYTQATASNGEFEQVKNLIGHELLALDDAYYIMLENIEKEGATYPDKERVEQHAASCLIAQYNVQLLCEELLTSSKHPDAKKYLEEFTRRLDNHRRQEDGYIAPNINYDLQVKNDFSGCELLTVDLILAHACQSAVKENRIEPLLFGVSLRCSLLQQSIHLLSASSHAQASEVRKKLLQRLAYCTAIHGSLIKQLEEVRNYEF